MLWACRYLRIVVKIIGSAIVLVCLLLTARIAWKGLIFGGASGADSSGKIVVKAGDDLQGAIDRARPGETIEIEAGATFTGPITLPFKTGDAVVTIRLRGLLICPRLETG